MIRDTARIIITPGKKINFSTLPELSLGLTGLLIEGLLGKRSIFGFQKAESRFLEAALESQSEGCEKKSARELQELFFGRFQEGI
jgi:hypothetical protein